MSRDIYIALEGVDGLQFVDEWNPTVEKALVQALNKAAEKGRTTADRRIRKQVNFPASYLRPSQGRLTVKSRASASRLMSVIEGRDRPTSLARFTKQKPLPRGKRHPKGEVNVQVKAGGARKAIKRAFLIELKNGNTGLAVRTDGSKPRGAYKPKLLSKNGDPNLWLLYGPSVDQALIAASDGRGVVQQMTPEVLDFLEDEFNRNMKRMGL